MLAYNNKLTRGRIIILRVIRYLIINQNTQQNKPMHIITPTLTLRLRSFSVSSAACDKGEFFSEFSLIDSESGTSSCMLSFEMATVM